MILSSAALPVALKTKHGLHYLLATNYDLQVKMYQICGGSWHILSNEQCYTEINSSCLMSIVTFRLSAVKAYIVCVYFVLVRF